MLIKSIQSTTTYSINRLATCFDQTWSSTSSSSEWSRERKAKYTQLYWNWDLKSLYTLLLIYIYIYIYIAKVDSLGSTNVKKLQMFKFLNIYIYIYILKAWNLLKGKKLRYIKWSPLKLRTSGWRTLTFQTTRCFYSEYGSMSLHTCYWRTSWSWAARMLPLMSLQRHCSLLETRSWVLGSISVNTKWYLAV